MISRLMPHYCHSFPGLRNIILSFLIHFFYAGVGSDGKESASNVGDLGLIPELGRYRAEGKGYLVQYSCLKSPMDRRAWQATVHGVAKSRTQLSD